MAITCLCTPIIQKKEIMVYINSKPLKFWTKIVSWSNLFNVECFAYGFHDSMEYANLTYEQQKILQHLISSILGIYFLEWTPGSGKKKIIKYLTKHLQTLGKQVILVVTTSATTSRISYKACIVRKYLKIPLWGYLYVLQQLNATLQKIQILNIIIIDEMSLLTNKLLNLVYMHIK